MRTKTNIIVGKGMISFLEQVKKYFPAGNIAIVYEDKELAFQLFAKLDTAMYKARLLSLAQISLPLPECVRFIVALGGQKVVEQVIKYSAEREFCIYANEINYRMFSCYKVAEGQKYDCAQFVYYDNAYLSVRDTKLLFECYCSVFSVLTECILNSYYECNLPYTDKGLFGIIESLKKLLIEGCDIDKYFSESLRLMKLGVEYLQSKNSDIFFSARALNLGKLDKDYQFIIDYFINLIVINFTKWNFFDMLIPAEKIIPEVPALKPNYRGDAQGILLTKEELSNITAKVKNLASLPKVESKQILKLIIDTVNGSTPLMAEINNRGILEGLLSYG